MVGDGLPDTPPHSLMWNLMCGVRPSQGHPLVTQSPPVSTVRLMTAKSPRTPVKCPRQDKPRVNPTCGGYRIDPFDPLLATDPAAVADLAITLSQARAGPTSRKSNGVAQMYERFCYQRNIQPFPPTTLGIGAFLNTKFYSCNWETISGYLSALRTATVAYRASSWTLDGDPLLADLIKAAKRLRPSRDRLPKFLVGVGVLKRILPFLDLEDSHDDRCMWSALTIAVQSLLRGGEFLFVKEKKEPLPRMLSSHLRIDSSGSRLDIFIVKDKAKWWRRQVTLSIWAAAHEQPPPKGYKVLRSSPGKIKLRILHEPAASLATPLSGRPLSCPLNVDLSGNQIKLLGSVCAISALSLYRRLSTVTLSSEGPAFVKADGHPLDKVFLFRRLNNLLYKAGVRSRSCPKVFLASFRAGGAMDLRSIKAPDEVIKSNGRWKSNAWQHYAIKDVLEREVFAKRMASIPPLSDIQSDPWIDSGWSATL